MALPTSKIEERAITALRLIIDEHLTMSHSFNSMDREMTWDGYLWIYKDNAAGQSKKNLDDKIPVQIKGHIDAKEEYLNKTRITFPVSIEDLNIYFNDRGVIYFQIFMTENNKKCEIFYSSLFPSKIKSYLDRAKVRQKNISVIFTKLEKTPDDIYSKAKQFSIESKKQGFGSGPLIQNIIPLENLDKVKSLKATVVGIDTAFDFIKSFSDGDISFYGEVSGIPFELPVEWSEKGKLSLYRLIKEPVKVGDILYYSEFEIKTSYCGETILKLGKSVEINMTQRKYNLKPISSIKELKKDADFLFAVMKNNSMTLGENIFKFKKISMPDDFEKLLKFFIALEDVLFALEFDYDKPFNQIPSQTLEELSLVSNIKCGHKVMEEKVYIYNLKIEDKYLPIVVIRNENNMTCDIINALYTKKYQTVIFNERMESFKVPMFHYISADILGNLVCYDYSLLYEKADKIDINEHTIEEINQSSLRMIQAYDINGDERLLQLSEYLMKKIEEIAGKEVYYIINRLQIKKRMLTFDDSDKNVLMNLETDSAPLLCGINVLLENTELAKNFYNKMTNEEHETFDEFPIDCLYQKMVR